MRNLNTEELSKCMAAVGQLWQRHRVWQQEWWQQEWQQERQQDQRQQGKADRV